VFEYTFRNTVQQHGHIMSSALTESVVFISRGRRTVGFSSRRNCPDAECCA